MTNKWLTTAKLQPFATVFAFEFIEMTVVNEMLAEEKKKDFLLVFVEVEKRETKSRFNILLWRCMFCQN